jgi:hypothetical protein
MERERRARKQPEGLQGQNIHVLIKNLAYGGVAGLGGLAVREALQTFGKFDSYLSMKRPFSLGRGFKEFLSPALTFSVRDFVHSNAESILPSGDSFSKYVVFNFVSGGISTAFPAIFLSLPRYSNIGKQFAFGFFAFGLYDNFRFFNAPNERIYSKEAFIGFKWIAAMLYALLTYKFVVVPLHNRIDGLKRPLGWRFCLLPSIQFSTSVVLFEELKERF